MFEVGDWIHAPYCNVSVMVFFVDEQYITVTIKCDLQDQHARCPYDITCVCIPREHWGECVVYPEKKISSLTQLHKVYVGTSQKRIATPETSSSYAGASV